MALGLVSTDTVFDDCIRALRKNRAGGVAFLCRCAGQTAAVRRAVNASRRWFQWQVRHTSTT